MTRRNPVSNAGLPVAPDRPVAAPLDAGAAITALRDRGAQRLDPVRFQFIEALARRATRHSGAARQVIDGKLAQALKDAGNRLAQAQPLAHPAADQLAGHAPGSAARAGQLPRTPLADLLHHIGRQAQTDGDSIAAAAGVAHADHPAELRTLRVFRSTWSKLGVDRQLTDSLAKVPENAGPLNSNLLVLRSLKLMKATSPAYLERFMSHVDALLWLDQASIGAAPVKTFTTPKRKPGRAKPG